MKTTQNDVKGLTTDREAKLKTLLDLDYLVRMVGYGQPMEVWNDPVRGPALRAERGEKMAAAKIAREAYRKATIAEKRALKGAE